MTAPRFVISGGQVFAGIDESLTSTNVVVSRTLIESVGSDVPSGLPVVDATGCTVLPGLIDSHVHLTATGAADIVAQIAGDSVPTATLHAARAAAAHVAAGTTTVRDLGARSGVAIDIARAVSRGLITGADVQAAGMPITMTGGHAHFLGVEADGPDELRKATRQMIKDGAQAIKVIASGGVLTKGVAAAQVTFGPDELRAVVDEAHHAGLRVAAHAIGGHGIKDAVRAGVDSIEHGFYLDDEAIALMLDRGTFLVPTMSGINAVLTGRAPDIEPWLHAKSVAIEADRRASFRRAAAAGVAFAAGTDAGTPGNFHGNVAEEIALLAECGLSPAGALLAATRNGAENLGLEDRGCLTPGRRADVLIVEGNPLTDFAALTRVRAVVQAGRLVAGDIADSVPDPM